MKITVNFSLFVDMFKKYDRFEQMGGYDGLKTLFDYIEEIEEDTGEQIELDVIGLCCDFSYMTEQDLINYYGYLMNNDEFEIDNFIEEVNNYTTVLRTEQGNYIVQAF